MWAHQPKKLSALRTRWDMPDRRRAFVPEDRCLMRLDWFDKHLQPQVGPGKASVPETTPAGQVSH